MDPRLLTILEQLRAARFADLAGARLAVNVPVAQRLINVLLAEAVPPGAPVAHVAVELRPGNELRVRLKLTRPAFMPPITVPVVIERQPELPVRPVLVLRFGAGAMGMLAGAVLRFAQSLPPGIRADGDRIFVDLAELLDREGYGDLLGYLEALEVTTGPAVLHVAVRAGIPG